MDVTKNVKSFLRELPVWLHDQPNHLTAPYRGLWAKEEKENEHWNKHQAHTGETLFRCEFVSYTCLFTDTSVFIYSKRWWARAVFFPVSYFQLKQEVGAGYKQGLVPLLKPPEPWLAEVVLETLKDIVILESILLGNTFEYVHECFSATC